MIQYFIFVCYFRYVDAPLILMLLAPASVLISFFHIVDADDGSALLHICQVEQTEAKWSLLFRHFALLLLQTPNSYLVPPLISHSSSASNQTRINLVLNIIIANNINIILERQDQQQYT